MDKLTSKTIEEAGIPLMRNVRASGGSKGADAVKSFSLVCTIFESNDVATGGLSVELLDRDEVSCRGSAHKSRSKEQSKGDDSERHLTLEAVSWK